MLTIKVHFLTIHVKSTFFAKIEVFSEAFKTLVKSIQRRGKGNGLGANARVKFEVGNGKMKRCKECPVKNVKIVKKCQK